MVRETDFLYLSEADTVVAGVLDTRRCVSVCEEAFRLLAAGDYLMGGPSRNSHGMGLSFPESSRFPNMPVAGPDRRFVTMPAYVGGRFDVCGNKWYGSNQANADKGLPRSVLTLMLNDRDTGVPLSLMSANLLSAARTGAVPALAARHLSPRAERLAVVGCGVISRAIVSALLPQLPSLKHVTFHDLRPVNAEQMAGWTAETFEIETAVAATAADCVAEADLVSVAASRERPLRIEASAFAPGASVLLSGPMISSEDFWRESTVVFDHIGLHEDYMREADLAPDRQRYYDSVIGGPVYREIERGARPALADCADLGQIIAGTAASGEPDPVRHTVFLACGMAVLDVAFGFELYRAALERGIGRRLDLWGDAGPHRN